MRIAECLDAAEVGRQGAEGAEEFERLSALVQPAQDTAVLQDGQVGDPVGV